MIKEKMKIIEDNIREILKESKDFLILDREFRDILAELKTNHTDLKNHKLELLNILLKHSKRKILFEFILKNDGSGYYSDTKITIGLNGDGLGLVEGSYEHNLKNVIKYYTRETFKKLLSKEDFVKEFLKHIDKHLRGKHKKLIRKLISQEEDITDKEILVGKININFDLDKSYHRIINYRFGVNGDYIDILETLQGKEKLKFSFSFESLREFCKLLEYKPKILTTLKIQLKDYQKINKKIQTKLAEIDKHLSPYKALQQI